MATAITMATAIIGLSPITDLVFRERAVNHLPGTNFGGVVNDLYCYCTDADGQRGDRAGAKSDDTHN